MTTNSRFNQQIPRDVCLNPQFERTTRKMRDLFMQFIADTTKQDLLNGIIEKAIGNELEISQHPAPLQIDPLPSVSHPTKSVIHAPPVGKKKERIFPLSYTIGPTPRRHKSRENKASKVEAMPLMTTITGNRAALEVPPLKELLKTALDNNISIQEKMIQDMLKDFQPRKLEIVTSDNEVSPICEKICTDIFGISFVFGRTLERKICFIKSQIGQKCLSGSLEVKSMYHE